MKRVGILLDFENLLITAEQDVVSRGILPPSLIKKLLPQIILSQVVKISKEIGQVGLAYAAISTPPPQGRVNQSYSEVRKTYKDRVSIWNSINLMVESGFEVMVVQHGPDAADRALGLLSNNFLSQDLDSVIIASQDGGEEFALMTKGFLGAGMEVVFIGYDRLIAPFHQGCVRLIHRLVLRDLERGAEGEEDSLVVLDVRRQHGSVSLKSVYGLLVKRMVSGQSVLNDSNNECLKRLLQAYVIIQSEKDFASYSVGKMRQFLEIRMDGVSRDEIKYIVFAIKDYGNLESGMETHPVS